MYDFIVFRYEVKAGDETKKRRNLLTQFQKDRFWGKRRILGSVAAMIIWWFDEIYNKRIIKNFQFELRYKYLEFLA